MSPPIAEHVHQVYSGTGMPEAVAVNNEPCIVQSAALPPPPPPQSSSAESAASLTTVDIRFEQSSRYIICMSGFLRSSSILHLHYVSCGQQRRSRSRHICRSCPAQVNGQIIGLDGQPLTLWGINWFGFETGTTMVDGLWAGMTQHNFPTSVSAQNCHAQGLTANS